MFAIELNRELNPNGGDFVAQKILVTFVTFLPEIHIFVV